MSHECNRPVAPMKSEYSMKVISGSFISRKKDFMTDVRTCTWYCENETSDISDTTQHISTATDHAGYYLPQTLTSTVTMSKVLHTEKSK